MSHPMSRRAFVGRAGGALFIAMVERHPLRALAAPSLPAAAGAAVRTVRVVRADDQLDVLVELVDVVVDGEQLVPSGAAPHVTLTFGSQHTAEDPLVAGETAGTAAAGELRAGPSVVVAPLSAATPFTLAAILDLAAAALTVADAGTVPDGTSTAIEAPAGLLLVPAAGTRLDAAHAPVTNGDTTEVWTARLVPAGASTPAPPVVEVAAVDRLLGARVPGDAIPDVDARADIARNSVEVAPIEARRLWLSSAGAFAALHGEWDGPSVGVARYDHRIVAGRDVHVQVVSTGYLLPFGQRAAVTEVAHRVVEQDTAGADTAAVRLSRHLTLLDPVAAVAPYTEHDGRGLPFTSTVASVDGSVEVELVAVSDGSGTVPGGFTVRSVGTGADVVVDYLASDRAGGLAAFSLPALFVDDDVAFDPSPAGSPARLRAWAATVSGLAEIDLGGQRVAYATPANAGSDTAKATHGVRLSWTAPTADATADLLRAAGSPAVRLAVESADVVDDVVSALGGEPGAVVAVRPHPRWLTFANDIGGNFDLSFLELDAVVSAVVGEDVTGAVANLEIVGEVFNQLLGLGPKLDRLEDWSPAAAFGAASKIIGNISLGDLLEAVVDDVLADALPGLTVDVDGDEIVTTYEMCQKLGSLPAVGFVAGDDTRLCVTLTTTTSLADVADASFTTEAAVEEFTLAFPPGFPTLVSVEFASVTATIGSDGTREVVPEIRGWDFSGATSALMALVDGLGLGNVDLQVFGDRLEIGTSVGLPDLSMGIVEISNFTISTGLELPLGDGPGAVSVGIGSKASPVDVNVMMFGGTFWLGIDLAFGGGTPPSTVLGFGVSVYWEMLEFDIVVVDISFALRLSADFRLASGEVVFTGAVSLEGNIEVLGLVDVTASIVASLTYDSAKEQLVLKGTVHYAVDSFLGTLTSGSVPIGSTTIELGNDGATARLGRSAAVRSLAGPGRASFADRYTAPVWTDYCDAFA